MAKRLHEAAAEILGANVTEKRNQAEKFGAGKNPQSYAPQPAAKVEDLGGVTPRDTGNNGITAASNAGPKGPNYPSKTPQTAKVGKPDAMENIRGGISDDETKKKRAKVNDSGVVTEEDEDKKKKKKMEEEGHANFEKNTTHPTAELGKAVDGSDTFIEEDKEKQEEESPGIPNACPVSDRVKKYFAAKTDNSDLTEALTNLFDGQGLSEEFKKKIKTVFEAAVTSRATQIAEAIEEDFANLLEATHNHLKEEMAEKVDDYLNYMVEEWVTENEIALDKGLRGELAEDFINGLKSLFIEHYIDIPEDKVNVVENLAAEVASLKESLDTEIGKNIESKKLITEFTVRDAVLQASNGLNAVQAAQLAKLAEGVDFDTVEDFKNSLQVLKEAHFTKATAKTVKLDEESVQGDERGIITEETKVLKNPDMEGYLKALKRTSRPK